MWIFFFFLLLVPVFLAGILPALSLHFSVLVTFFPDLAGMNGEFSLNNLLVLLVSTMMTWVTCLLIIAVAIFAAWGYWRDSKRVKEELVRFSSDIDNLEKSGNVSSAWEAFLDVGFGQYDKTTQALWLRYQGVLVDVEGIARPNNVGADCRLMSFVAPSEFFNEETLYTSRINRELY